MLTQLSTVKARLGLTTTSDDGILTNMITAVSARFDQICRRTFARTVDATQEFNADDTEIAPMAYPLESVGSFALKTSEVSGWIAVSPDPDYLVRRDCVISLTVRLGTWRQTARVTYTGGYVLPGTTPSAGQTALPSDVEQACVEQVAYWYQNRANLGLTSLTVSADYKKFATLDLLAGVQAVLSGYERWKG